MVFLDMAEKQSPFYRMYLGLLSIPVLLAACGPDITAPNPDSNPTGIPGRPTEVRLNALSTPLPDDLVLPAGINPQQVEHVIKRDDGNYYITIINPTPTPTRVTETQEATPLPTLETTPTPQLEQIPPESYSTSSIPKWLEFYWEQDSNPITLQVPSTNFQLRTGLDGTSFWADFIDTADGYTARAQTRENYPRASILWFDDNTAVVIAKTQNEGKLKFLFIQYQSTETTGSSGLLQIRKTFDTSINGHLVPPYNIDNWPENLESEEFLVLTPQLG